MSAIRPTLDELQSRDDFLHRHIGPDTIQTQAMLASLGYDSLQELTEKVLPECIVSHSGLDLKAPVTEPEVLSELRLIADQNTLVKSLIGCGYFGTFLPPVIQRNVVENPAWYTAYTPYQPEISQGRLEALLTFQQVIMDMTGMDIANASLLDEATAAAEAMTMTKRLSKSKSNRFLVASDCLPQTLAVVRTRARYLGINVEIFDPQQPPATVDCFGLLLQYPGTSGVVRDLTNTIAAVHKQKGLAVVAADLLALALLRPPSEFDADIVVGNNQRFGVPLGFGGPHAGYMATRDAYKRQCPGRFIGVSIDTEGNPAMRLALQTREQHIRRDKATSNICTAQVLLANISAFYAIYHGPEGIHRIAQRVHRLTCALANGLQQMGISVVHKRYFDTLLLQVPGRAGALLGAAVRAGYNLRHCDTDYLAVSLDETVTTEDVDNLLQVLGGDQHSTALTAATLDTISRSAIPETLQRQTNYLQHPVFNRYHSETNMMRYLRRLQEKDITLDRSMTPLGSCTMKLNAVTEMMPVTWPEFSDLHPFAPPSQTAGYQHLFTDVQQMLCALTGFSAVSLQQNAGSQGEYSGLLCIRRYHESRGQGQRNICLIPSSAHGTNPASAALAGFVVVVIRSDPAGNVDIDDLRKKAVQHADTLAAFMITYPSTHGVFEAAIHTYCGIIHEHGGQVYFDGANLNAQLGLTKPA
ncbi:MAG TPA: glycine dehydrogenase (aminomethyl-transferring), partial [Gammaproteobacteria bacterium]|nr:glycine dehydrogenase (aminomethyl-transferring) [Gammaproteobacteria bacterium]